MMKKIFFLTAVFSNFYMVEIPAQSLNFSGSFFNHQKTPFPPPVISKAEAQRPLKENDYISIGKTHIENNSNWFDYADVYVVLKKKSVDKKQNRHLHYQIYFKDFRIETSEVIIHITHNGTVFASNGYISPLFPIDDIGTSQIISQDQAEKIALDNQGTGKIIKSFKMVRAKSPQFIWEIEVDSGYYSNHYLINAENGEILNNKKIIVQ